MNHIHDVPKSLLQLHKLQPLCLVSDHDIQGLTAEVAALCSNRPHRGINGTLNCFDLAISISQPPLPTAMTKAVANSSSCNNNNPNTNNSFSPPQNLFYHNNTVVGLPGGMAQSQQHSPSLASMLNQDSNRSARAARLALAALSALMAGASLAGGCQLSSAENSPLGNALAAIGNSPRGVGTANALGCFGTNKVSPCSIEIQLPPPILPIIDPNQQQGHELSMSWSPPAGLSPSSCSMPTSGGIMPLSPFIASAAINDHYQATVMAEPCKNSVKLMLLFEYDAIYAADKIKLVRSEGNEEIISQLKTARNGFLQAIEIIDTLLGTPHKTKPFHQKDPEVSWRNDETEGVLGKLTTAMGPCFCKGTAHLIHSFINASHTGGIALVQSICRQLDKKKSPITTSECEKFESNLFGSTIKMAIELTGEDVMCELVAGPCDPPSNSTVDTTMPFTCSFCHLLHKKAATIAHNFVNLFDGFQMLCNRLTADSDKAVCLLHVKRMTRDIAYIIDINLAQTNVYHFCKSTFKCV